LQDHLQLKVVVRSANSTGSGVQAVSNLSAELPLPVAEPYALIQSLFFFAGCPWSLQESKFLVGEILPNPSENLGSMLSRQQKSGWFTPAKIWLARHPDARASRIVH
jgi:hypothetical protein